MSVLNFIESYDLSGKTIIQFFSYNGSSSGAISLDTLAAACHDSTVLTDEALSIYGSDVDNSENEIREWVKNLNN